MSVLKRNSIIPFTLIFGGALVLGWMANLALQPHNPSYADVTNLPAEAQRQLDVATDLSAAFQHTAESVRRSVVSISSVTKVRAARRGANPGIPDEFRRFFGDDFDRFFEMPVPDGEQRGLGSGVIVSADGHIITNNHVVGSADEISVELSDGRKFDDEVVGADKATDVAILKIEGSGFTPVTLGDSDRTRVGEWVLAIGSPMGLNQTVTAGIISAKGRDRVGILGRGGYEDFLQTDAAINPGNSGGPLVNLRGEVIGINTAIASRSGGNMGIGFAIPSNMVQYVMSSILRDGEVIRGGLGAMIQDLTPELSQSFKFKTTDGVLIGDVVDDSPAAKAGLKSGDIVVRFNGRRTVNATALRNAVAATAPNTTVTLDVHRNGQLTQLKVLIGRLDDEVLAAATRSGEGQRSSALDIQVQTLTPDLAKQLNLNSNQQGVVVTSVNRGGLAARSGIQQGDVIVDVNGNAVRNLDDFERLVTEESLSDGVRLRVLSEGTSRFVYIRRRVKG
mgnify:CR=1 FL=1